MAKRRGGKRSRLDRSDLGHGAFHSCKPHSVIQCEENVQVGTLTAVHTQGGHNSWDASHTRAPEREPPPSIPHTAREERARKRTQRTGRDHCATHELSRCRGKLPQLRMQDLHVHYLQTGGHADQQHALPLPVDDNPEGGDARSKNNAESRIDSGVRAQANSQKPPNC